MFGMSSHLYALAIAFFILIVVVLCVWCSLNRRCTELECCSRDSRRQKKKVGCDEFEPRFLCVAAVDALPVVIDDTTILAIAFDSVKLVERCENKWTPAFSLIDSTSIVGYRVPKTGAYWVEYHTAVIAGGAFAYTLVNGEILQRSISWTLDLPLEEVDLNARMLGKSFIAHLQCGDIVSVIVIPAPSAGVPIGDGFSYLHTLSLSLLDGSCKYAHSEQDVIAGPLLEFVTESSSSSSSSTAVASTSKGLTAVTSSPTVQKIKALGEFLKTKPASLESFQAHIATALA